VRGKITQGIGITQCNGYPSPFFLHLLSFYLLSLENKKKALLHKLKLQTFLLFAIYSTAA
jgi:hypothetical protein